MRHIYSYIRQKYGDMQLQSKITIVLMVVVTIPVLMLGIFFYGRLYDMVVSYTIRQEQDASAKTSPVIEETVQQVLDAYETLSALPFYDAAFHAQIGSMDSLADSASAAEFQEAIGQLTDEDLITSIRVYADLPGEDCALFKHPHTKDIFRPLSSVRGTYWYGIFRSSSAEELFCPSFYLGTQEKEANGDIAYIHIAQMNDGGETVPCYVAVYFSASSLTDILVNNLKLEGSVSYIMNERNALVASSDASLSGIYWLDYDAIRDSVMSSNNFIERTILEHKVYAGFYSIARTPWYMVTILPSDPLIQQSNSIMFEYILFYLAFLILAFLLASLLARSVTKRISSVIDQMRLVRQGPPVPMEDSRYHDEVGDLIDTYNYMTRTMDRLMAEQARAAEDLRIAEFNSLQAQINPHFLYNTMDMINWLAQQGRTSEVSDTVQALSRFYKLTLSRKQSISTIAQEEEHVSIYVRLQNMRFHGRISFISDIPDELLEYCIPKLTLQPVIENAVLHGILEKDSKEGTIVLTCWMEGEDIVLLVSDDGVGIPPEKLRTILTGDGSSSSGGTNIAVYNTHRRLQILYGKDYGLSYSSIPGKGTDVQIRIPATKEPQKSYIYASASGTSEPGGSMLSLASVTNAAGPVADASADAPASAGNGSATGRHAPADGGLSAPAQAVSAETLLSYSQKLTQNLYNIQNLHQIFSRLPENENLYILTHQVTEDFPAHKHDYFELNYVCQGSLCNVVDGKEIRMETGDLVFLNQSAIHSLRFLQPDTLLINFCLEPALFDGTLKCFREDRNPLSSFLRGNSSSRNYMYYSLKNNFHAQSIIASIIQEYADNGFHQSFSLEAYFLLLFACLTDTDTDERSQTSRQSTRHANKQHDPDYARGAGKAGSTDRRNTGNIGSTNRRNAGNAGDQALLLHASRLNKALELMADPKRNIYEIAKSCGYQDANEFFEVFRRQFHTTPDEYRKNFL